MIEFEYLNLAWLALLPPVIWLLPFVYVSRRTALRVPFLGALKRASGARETKKQAYSRATLLQKLSALAVWLLVVLALMKPEYIGKPIVKDIAQRELIIAVDLSKSMQTRDVKTMAGGETSRLGAVKEVLNSFLDLRKGEKIALIVFGTHAYVQAPFTADLKIVKTLLDQTRVGMAGPKTAIGDAIGLSIKIFEKSKIGFRDRLVILLTDGADTASRVPPQKAAGMALDRGIKIFTIGFGNPKHAGDNPVDVKTLTYIAQHTRGRFFYAKDTAHLKAITDEINKLKPREVKKLSWRPTRQLFIYPVALAFLILALNAFVLFVRKSRAGREARA